MFIFRQSRAGSAFDLVCTRLLRSSGIMFRSHGAGLLFIAALANAYDRATINVDYPQSSAPLDESLAYYQLTGHNGAEQKLTHGFFATDCGANLSVHYTEPSVWGSATGTATRPILILTHGYPESSYIWRDVTPTVSARTPVFVADQPGYGLSTACCHGQVCAYDKRTYARAMMQAVKAIYGDVHVIYAGHDRGARTMVGSRSLANG